MTTGQSMQGVARGAVRMPFMDNLRTFIVLLVVMFHGGVGYMVHMPSWWYVPDARKVIAADAFLALTEVFMMPLMVMIAGYFARRSLARSGPGRFMMGRVTRLVVPWVVGVVVFTPMITYVALAARGEAPEHAGAFFGSYFGSRLFHHAHYWFLGFLAAMSAMLAAWVRWRGMALGAVVRVRGLSVWEYAGLLLSCAGSMFAINVWVPDDTWWVWGYVVSVQPTRVGIYVTWFVLGLLAHRRGWFEQGGYAPEPRRWVGIAIVAGAIDLAWRSWSLRHGGTGVMAINAWMHAVLCLGAGMACLGVFRKYVDYTPRWVAGLVRNSFGIYFIHFVIVVGVAHAASAWDLPAAVKWGVVSLGSIAVSWCVSEFALTRLPGIRRVFA
jgi:surface polysaccharide O-acyltransferase-like enzyme